MKKKSICILLIMILLFKFIFPNIVIGVDIKIDGLTYFIKYPFKNLCGVMVYDSDGTDEDSVIVYSNVDGKNAKRLICLELLSKKINKIEISEGFEEILYALEGNYWAGSAINCNSEENIEVQLPSTMKIIGRTAFRDCPKLTTINLVEGIQEIGESAFYQTNIERAIIPDSVTTIGRVAFQECKNLKEVKLSNSLTTIEALVFCDCTNLENIIIPEGVKVIGSSAFAKTNIKEFNIPSSVEKINGLGALGSTSLEKVVINNPNVTIADEAFKYAKEGFVIYGYKGSTAETFATKFGYNFVDIEELDDSGNNGNENENNGNNNSNPEEDEKKEINNKGDEDSQTEIIDINGVLYELNNETGKVKVIGVCEGYTSKYGNTLEIKSDIEVKGKKYPITEILENAFAKLEIEYILCERESKAEEYAKSRDILVKYIGEFEADEVTPFVYGRDNYNFFNGEGFDSYSIGEFKRYLSNTLLERIKEDESREVGGVCSGFVQTLMLFKLGYLTPNYWQVAGKEAQNVYEIEKPGNGNYRIKHLINLYQNLQWYTIAEEKEYNSIEEFYNSVQNYYDNLDGNNSFLGLAFRWVYDFGEIEGVDDRVFSFHKGHAVMIIDRPQILDDDFYNSLDPYLISLDERYDLTKWKYRIPIYDSNSRVYNTYFYLNENFTEMVYGMEDQIFNRYFTNTNNLPFESENAEIGDLSDLSTFTPDALLNFSSFEYCIKNGLKMELDSDGILSYKADASLKITNADGKYADIEGITKTDGSLDCDIRPEVGYVPELNNAIENSDIILDNEDWYSVEAISENLDVSLYFGDSYMEAKTKSGGKAIFENKKSVTLSNSSGEEYEAKITLNDKFIKLPWYTITATGTNSKEIKLEMVDEGVLISGDDLTNVVIKGNNLEETVELKLNTDEKQVLIKASDDETKMIAYVYITENGKMIEKAIGESKERVESINAVKAGDSIIYRIITLVIYVITLVIMIILKRRK